LMFEQAYAFFINVWKGVVK